MPQINVETARNLTAYWEGIRGSSAVAQTILQPYHYFELDERFDWTDFIIPGVVTRGYIGYEEPRGGGYDPGNLRLILINADKDKQLAAGDLSDPYIYATVYTPSNIPVPGPVQADEKISRWVQGYENWCTSVDPAGGPAGMTRVFDIPLFDLLKQVPVGSKNLEVFFGLRLPHGNPQLDIDFITFHPETQKILHFMSVDDFTSPKPPFGSTAEQNTYGLLN